MGIRNLDKIFKPKRVAVIGASGNRSSVGYTVFRNLVGSGYSGVVYPVNPKRESVQGIHAYPTVTALPSIPDLAVICTPAHTVPGLVRECGTAGIKGIVINSAGFKETGEEGRDLEDRVSEEAAAFPGTRIIGPNCLGVIVPSLRLNASFAGAMPQAGHVAFISQSGALCTSVLDWALERNIGFSFFVSIGNMLDVDFGDLIDYFGEDPHTRSMILYMESITESREFMSAARAFSKHKPVVAYKSGRFAESAQAAASHTGALAGEDAVYDAALQRAGIVRVAEIDDVFDCAELVARTRAPTGSRLAIVTNAGGPGGMATDALLAREGALATLSDDTLERLNKALPAFWSRGNPVDVLGDAGPDRFVEATEIVLSDPEVDAALVILTPQAMTDPSVTAESLANLAEKSSKPILAAWMGGRTVQQGLRTLAQHGVPAYTTPEQAVRAFMHLVHYARNLEVLYETPREIPVQLSMDRDTIKDKFASLTSADSLTLSEQASKDLLEAYGIPVTEVHETHSADEAVAVAHELGYPVVLKVLSPDITHKTDVGGVVLDLHDEPEVRRAYERIVDAAREQRPEAEVLGVTVQRMVNAKHGFELILGAKHDPAFGAVIMVGTGGTAAEVFRDRALGLPPLNERLARRLLESLNAWPLLTGYRGRPPIDLDKLLQVLMRFSYLVAEHPAIAELDINPLLVTPHEAVALDARLIVDPERLSRDVRPYEHLAIRPYPDEYVRKVTGTDGKTVTLRPIRPEDEPLWHEMLRVSSRESIRFRFQYIFKESTHEMATRYCFIDYDREMAIVAELEEEGERKIAGVGRLVAGPDPSTAEYAVFVADPWQGQGLGNQLTDYCLEIAAGWGVSHVTAETTPDNRRMLAIFESRGFRLERRSEEGVVLAHKDLEGS